MVKRRMIAEGEVDILINATCTSLVKAAEAAIRAQISSSYCDNELLGTSFPVQPGAKYRFRRDVFVGGSGWLDSDQISIDSFRREMKLEGFTGNVAAWLVLMASVRFSSFVTVFTLLQESEPLKFNNGSTHTPHLIIGRGGSGLLLRHVGSMLRCDSEIWSFCEKA